MFTDSTQNLPYRPGYDHAHPFGTAVPYALDTTTGDITFTPQDSGIYYLAYQITEYRDGMPLGTIQATRLAFVLDTNATLPTAGPIQNVQLYGATYDPALRKFSVCQNGSLEFDAPVTSPLPDAQIILDEGFSKALPGPATASYTGISTAAANLHLTWTAPEGAGGQIYYAYIDWADTACGPGHFPSHQSRGYTIAIGQCLVMPNGVVETTAPAAGAMEVYPNPAGNGGGAVLKAALHGPAAWATAAALVDVSGRTVAVWNAPQQHRAAHGVTTVQLPLPALPAGVYVLAVRGSGGQVWREKVVLR